VLKHLHQRLEHQLEDTKAEVTELREKLTQLWDRLHEEYRHREEFLTTHRGHSTGTLKAVCIAFWSLVNKVKQIYVTYVVKTVAPLPVAIRAVAITYKGVKRL
jgi:arginine deiminase